MAWIELHQSLWTHRKTVLLSAILDVDELYAGAHMAKLWTWALDNAPDGDISGLPPRVIAYGADWKGDAIQFVEAAISCGWVDRDGEKLHLHDWYDYAGRLLEKKNANKERAKKSRERYANGARTEPVQTAHVAGLPNLTKPYLTKPNHSNSMSKKVGTEPTKINYSDFVSLKQDEYEKLVAEHGEDGAEEMIDILNSYKAANGKKYASDYHTMTGRGWVLQRFKEEQLKKPKKVAYDPYRPLLDDVPMEGYG